MASYYHELYKTRIKHDCHAQPHFLDEYQSLNDDLKKRASSLDLHPYEMRRLIDFTKNYCYLHGDKTWYNGIINNTDIFLYRIDNLFKLLVYNNMNTVNKSNLRRKYAVSRFNLDQVDESEVPELFENLKINTKDWVALEEILAKYQTPRGITWWTTEDLSNCKDQNSLMNAAQKLGLATNWINSYSVVIKCNLHIFKEYNNVNDIKVPSIIDAYNSPIFFPRLQLDSPEHGIAINLKEMNLNGSKEFVIRNIILKSLSFQLIKVSDDTKKKNSFCEETDDLYQRIISLY